MRILGIHDGHNASACLLEDGRVRYVFQEERLTNLKNYVGFPVRSIRRILETYEDETGRGGMLNTSFNLHGYPIVHGPKEALWTFANSGLRYLALGDFIIRKKGA